MSLRCPLSVCLDSRVHTQSYVQDVKNHVNSEAAIPSFCWDIETCVVFVNPTANPNERLATDMRLHVYGIVPKVEFTLLGKNTVMMYCLSHRLTY